MGRGERRVLKGKGLKEENKRSDNQSSEKASYDLHFSHVDGCGLVLSTICPAITYSVFLGILQEGGGTKSDST